MNICSSLALEELTKSGKINKQQKYYLYVFTRLDFPVIVSHVEATSKVYEIFGVKLPARNARIRELELMGFIGKYYKGKCSTTGKLVNFYIWTGRTEPLQCKFEWVRCSHCGGAGGKTRKVYVKEEGQKQLNFT